MTFPPFACEQAAAFLILSICSAWANWQDFIVRLVNRFLLWEKSINQIHFFVTRIFRKSASHINQPRLPIGKSVIGWICNIFIFATGWFVTLQWAYLQYAEIFHNFINLFVKSWSECLYPMFLDLLALTEYWKWARNWHERWSLLGDNTKSAPTFIFEESFKLFET